MTYSEFILVAGVQTTQAIEIHQVKELLIVKSKILIPVFLIGAALAGCLLRGDVLNHAIAVVASAVWGS